MPPSQLSYPVTIQLSSVARSDRWRISYRLQELMIASNCAPEGSLQIEVNTALAAILVHSVFRQYVMSRQELVDWLERCWDNKYKY